MSVRDLRVVSGLTQEQLAEKSGMSVRAIRDIERGSTRRPYRQSLQRVAEAMGLTELETVDLIGMVYMQPHGRRRSPCDSPRSPAAKHDTTQQALAHLPPGPKGFLWRTDELRWLDQLLNDAGDGFSTAVLSGAPGVGKTVIALRWSHLSKERFSDGVLYADLLGFDARPAVSPESVLRRFLRALGIADHRIPLSLEECSALYRAVLADRNALIVLDNAADVEQVRPLLTDASRCRVIITSRNAMTGLVVRDGAHRYRVDYLSDAEALALFESVVGAQSTRREPEAALSLLALCDRSPLAVRLMAERIANQRYMSMTDAADRISAAKLPLNTFETPGDPHSSIRDLMSWSYRELPAEIAGVFDSIGFLNSVTFRFEDIAVAGSASRMPAEEVATALEWLLEVHLLEEEMPGTYRINKLLWWYAQEMTDQTGER
ncbi:NB-ARC domain-containing protein [Streptomyces sp. NPDC086549]|uniref:NB-ARC domain-containing protein n=1 Tax=Streptomyces sp. NPDC086549 TaxID=3365752 RepID=UPI0038144E73